MRKRGLRLASLMLAGSGLVGIVTFSVQPGASSPVAPRAELVKSTLNDRDYIDQHNSSPSHFAGPKPPIRSEPMWLAFVCELQRQDTSCPSVLIGTKRIVGRCGRYRHARPGAW